MPMAATRGMPFSLLRPLGDIWEPCTTLLWGSLKLTNILFNARNARLLLAVRQVETLSSLRALSSWGPSRYLATITLHSHSHLELTTLLPPPKFAVHGSLADTTLSDNIPPSYPGLRFDFMSALHILIFSIYRTLDPSPDVACLLMVASIHASGAQSSSIPFVPPFLLLVIRLVFCFSLDPSCQALVHPRSTAKSNVLDSSQPLSQHWLA